MIINDDNFQILLAVAAFATKNSQKKKKKMRFSAYPNSKGMFGNSEDFLSIKVS